MSHPSTLSSPQRARNVLTVFLDADGSSHSGEAPQLKTAIYLIAHFHALPTFFALTERSNDNIHDHLYDF